MNVLSNIVPLCSDSSVSGPHNGGHSINHVTACSTALQLHGWIASKNVRLEAAGKSRNWTWNLSCSARSTTAVVESDERLADVERAESSVDDGVQDCSNSGGGESDGSDEKGKYRLRWNMLLSTEALGEAHLLRAGSVTDAHVLRRKGRLKEQDGLIEFIISMHKTHSPVQIRVWWESSCMQSSSYSTPDYTLNNSYIGWCIEDGCLCICNGTQTCTHTRQLGSALKMVASAYLASSTLLTFTEYFLDC